MTSKTLTLRSTDIPHIHKFAIGFDSMFDELLRLDSRQTSDNYPPYNIIQQSENEFIISIAVAGFGLDNLSIIKEKNFLVVTGTSPNNKIDDGDIECKYLYKGIGYRNFKREFKLADHVNIVTANLELGILNIHLKREIPEEEKPKTIAINYTK